MARNDLTTVVLYDQRNLFRSTELISRQKSGEMLRIPLLDLPHEPALQQAWRILDPVLPLWMTLLHQIKFYFTISELTVKVMPLPHWTGLTSHASGDTLIV